MGLCVVRIQVELLFSYHFSALQEKERDKKNLHQQEDKLLNINSVFIFGMEVVYIFILLMFACILLVEIHVCAIEREQLNNIQCFGIDNFSACKIYIMWPKELHHPEIMCSTCVYVSLSFLCCLSHSARLFGNYHRMKCICKLTYNFHTSPLN